MPAGRARAAKDACCGALSSPGLAGSCLGSRGVRPSWAQKGKGTGSEARERRSYAAVVD